LIAIEGDHDHLMSLEDLPEKMIKDIQAELHEAGTVTLSDSDGSDQVEVTRSNVDPIR
jgi:hypothetical protein